MIADLNPKAAYPSKGNYLLKIHPGPYSLSVIEPNSHFHFG